MPSLRMQRPFPLTDDIEVLEDGSTYPSALEMCRKLNSRGRTPGLSLAEFASMAWETVEHDTELQWNWHVDFLCEHIQAVLEGPDAGHAWAQNLLINVPPGTMKSLVLSVFTPAWMWLWRPSWRVLYACSNPTVSMRDAVKCRNLVASDWYKETFKPAWKLSDDVSAKSNFANDKGGVRIAIGMESAITGARVDAIMIDDPLDAKDAPSKPIRESVNFNFDQAIANRVAEPKRSTRIVIMQRLHEEDLSGHLLAGGGWAHVCLPMEFEKEGPGAAPTFIGVKDPRTEEGELLFPQRFPTEVLDGEKKRLGTSGYAGQMQQRPASAAGNKFKKEWWRFWSPTGELLPRPRGCSTVPPKRLNLSTDLFDEILGSWDCAFTKSATSDYVVGIVLGRIGADKFVLWRFREKADFPETQRALIQMRKDWPLCWEILIEKKANGDAVLQTLGSVISGIVPVNPMGGKEARAAAVEPQVEAGNIYLPEGAEWLEEWVEEFASFPKGKHDDQVDALSQAIIKMLEDSEIGIARALLSPTPAFL